MVFSLAISTSKSRLQLFHTAKYTLVQAWIVSKRCCGLCCRKGNIYVIARVASGIVIYYCWCFGAQGMCCALASFFPLLFCFFLVPFHHSVLKAQGVREGQSLQTPGSGASTGVTSRDATKCTQKAPTWRPTGGRTQVRLCWHCVAWLRQADSFLPNTGPIELASYTNRQKSGWK